jgi:hypothetical protein
VKQIAAHIDVLPTLVNLCGLKLPKEIQFDGTSLKPLMESKTGKSKEVNWLGRILITDSQRVEHPIKWRKSSVLTNQWRLVNGEELYDIQTDPEQRVNVAAQFPEEIRRLREAYEEWWINVSERFDVEPPIIIGSEYENPVMLTCHDWHSVEGVRQAISGQVYIRRGDPLSGYWAVEISREGMYEITMRRWPEEVNAAIIDPLPGVQERTGTIALPPGQAIKATHARLSVGDHIFEELIPPGAAAVSFKVQLKPMNTKLQTWFLDQESGETHGAYFVYVKRL